MVIPRLGWVVPRWSFPPSLDHAAVLTPHRASLSRDARIKQGHAEEEMIIQKTIVVIGGTGLLGQPVSRCLKEAGFRVRIMTRDPHKANKLFDGSFEIVAGDPIDTGCLEQA